MGSLDRRRKARLQPQPRALTDEERLAHVICEAVNYGGCKCAAAPATCSKMVWAAKRVMRHLGIRKEEA